MGFPHQLVTFYNLNQPDIHRCVWVNYDHNGKFLDFTDYYGAQLKLVDSNRIFINGDLWQKKSEN